jgi:hypothetical protein
MLRTAVNLIAKPSRRVGFVARPHNCAPLPVHQATLLLLVTAICLVSRLLLPAHAISQDSEEGFISREYPLKALFIYNFASYIDWPESAFVDPKSFTIGVLGSSPIAETLNQIATSKQISGRKIAIAQLVSINDIKQCQILFIARSVSVAQERQVIDAMKDRPVLLVGESEGFAAIGGDVNFFIESNRVRFEINLAAMRKQGLKASSKLLAMAKIVEPAPSQR